MTCRACGKEIFRKWFVFCKECKSTEVTKIINGREVPFIEVNQKLCRVNRLYTRAYQMKNRQELNHKDREKQARRAAEDPDYYKKKYARYREHNREHARWYYHNVVKLRRAKKGTTQ